jgi:hypothetical protein
MDSDQARRTVDNRCSGTTSVAGNKFAERKSDAHAISYAFGTLCRPGARQKFALLEHSYMDSVVAYTTTGHAFTVHFPLTTFTISDYGWRRPRCSNLTHINLGKYIGNNRAIKSQTMCKSSSRPALRNTHLALADVLVVTVLIGLRGVGRETIGRVARVIRARGQWPAACRRAAAAVQRVAKLHQLRAVHDQAGRGVTCHGRARLELPAAHGLAIAAQSWIAKLHRLRRVGNRARDACVAVATLHDLAARLVAAAHFRWVAVLQGLCRVWGQVPCRVAYVGGAALQRPAARGLRAKRAILYCFKKQSTGHKHVCSIYHSEIHAIP